MRFMKEQIDFTTRPIAQSFNGIHQAF